MCGDFTSMLRKLDMVGDCASLWIRWKVDGKEERDGEKGFEEKAEKSVE